MESVGAKPAYILNKELSLPELEDEWDKRFNTLSALLELGMVTDFSKVSNPYHINMCCITLSDLIDELREIQMCMAQQAKSYHR